MLNELEKAFVLHTRPFKETSLIVELFTQNFGRISVVAKGAKRPKSKFNYLMQPFLPLLVMWQGNGSLYTLVKAEQEEIAFTFLGKQLLSGLYINELLMKLLAVGDPHSNIFKDYSYTLKELTKEKPLAVTLRYFEANLLKFLGYELQLEYDISNNERIKPDLNYVFIVDKGPIELTNYVNRYQNAIGIYKGSSLIALRENNITSREEIINTKKFMQNVIHYYLDGKKLKVKEIFC